jgi:CDGSH-type Zn-finger protein
MDQSSTTESALQGADLQLASNGPLMVSGEFKVLDAEGKIIETKKKAFLCRCGSSKNKPFCDGSHNTNGFEG